MKDRYMKLIKKRHILFISLLSLSAFFSQCAKQSEEILDFLDNGGTKSFKYGGTTYITDQSILGISAVETGEITYDTTYWSPTITEDGVTEEACYERDIRSPWIQTSSGTGTSRTDGFIPPTGLCTYICDKCDTILEEVPLLEWSVNLFITNSIDINTDAEGIDDLSEGEYTLKLSFQDVEIPIKNVTIDYPDAIGTRDFAIFIKDENLEVTSARGHVVIDSITDSYARLSYNIIIDEETETRIIGRYAGEVFNDIFSSIELE